MAQGDHDETAETGAANAACAAPTAFAAHDHAGCAARAMVAAEAACAAADLKLTPVRRRVLEILWEEHRPQGAYRILERLKAEGLGSQPPAVYRALEFLIEAGLAHRIASRNAYVACEHPGRDHAPQFLICKACEATGEVIDDAMVESVRRVARVGGFEAEAPQLEVEGLCRACGRAEAVS